MTEVETANGFDREQVLFHAAQAESYSNHPIGKSILSAYGKPVDQSVISDYQEISGHGISICSEGKKILAGNSKLMGCRADSLHALRCNRNQGICGNRRRVCRVHSDFR